MKTRTLAWLVVTVVVWAEPFSVSGQAGSSSGAGTTAEGRSSGGTDSAARAATSSLVLRMRDAKEMAERKAKAGEMVA
ncbi:MAG: hypothetical protein V2A73_22845, partial [Pseudomonadota bacterium]